MRNWSFYALLLTAALLPWYVIRWHVAGIPTTLLEIATLVTIGLWLVEKTIFEDWRRVAHFWQGQKFLAVLLVLFLVSALIGTLVSPNRHEALGILKAYIVEPLMLLLVAVDTVGGDESRWWQLAAALWVAGLQVSTVSLSQALFHWPVTAPAEMAQGRSSSFYNTANAVGLFLGPLIAVAIGALLSGKLKRWQMSVLIGWTALALLAIGLSHSRGAFLGCAAIVATFIVGWLVGHMRKPVNRRLFSTSIALAVCLYLALSLGFVWFVNNPPKVANPYTRPGFSTLTVRQCLWQGTKAMLQASPVVGAGLSGFTKAYLQHTTCDAEPLVYPHLLALNFWSELGILGLVVTMTIIGWWLWQSGNVALRHDGWYWVGVGLAAAAAYWMVHGLDDVPYFKNDLSSEWWIICALIVALSLVIGSAERALPRHLPAQS